MDRKIIRLEKVGEVLLERSIRARRIHLTVRPGGRIRVAVPRGIPFELAAQFAHSKSEWIRDRQQELLETVRKAELLCAVPINLPKARRRLQERLAALAARHGFLYRRVSIRNQRTRWGTCSMRNNISLNINLVRLPSELMDYVLLHELVHTRIKNHGPQFWSELERHLPKCRELDRGLDDYRGLLGRL